MKIYQVFRRTKRKIIMEGTFTDFHAAQKCFDKLQSTYDYHALTLYVLDSFDNYKDWDEAESPEEDMQMVFNLKHL